MLHMHDRKSDGFAQRLLIRPPEQRATNKPLLAGYSPAGTKSDQETSACRLFASRNIKSDQETSACRLFARRNIERPRNLCLQGRMQPAVRRFEYISIRYNVHFNVHTLCIFFLVLFIYLFTSPRLLCKVYEYV